MDLAVRYAPRFTAAEAAGLAAVLFGVDGPADPLPSERDQNFRITTATGERFVLKIANAAEPADVLDLQNAALAHLAAHGVSGAPRVLPALDGRPVADTTARDGARHHVRLLTWVPGRPLAGVHPHLPPLLESLGRRLGESDRALAGFSHPAMRRALPWDVAATPWIREHLTRLPDAARRTVIGRLLERFERDAVPRLAALRGSVIHNDWNDHNVLVEMNAAGEMGVVGAVDFGDLLYSRTICDLAIACAYAMLGKPDPVAAAAAVVRGYHAASPIPEAELPVLFDLICGRLCISATMAALQYAAAPDNEYLLISQQRVWPLLERLDAMPPAWAHYAFRHACGLTPCPRETAVRAWLARDRAAPARVIDREASGATLVFDFSPGSPDLPFPADAEDVETATARLFARMREAGAAVGVGRYDEARLFYAGDRFRRTGNDGPEHRTVHIGLDLFAGPGTPVLAAFDGTIHGFRNNAAPFDYGPTIVLRHETDEGVELFTLYGHLSLESLDGLRPGGAVRAGDRIGAIGEPAVNGGWTPHVHFQIVLDLLGHDGDFPGVAPAGERAIWLSLCPDPNLALRIPDAVFPPLPPAGPEIRELRRRAVGRGLSLSYWRPLAIVRGFGQHLVDEDGRRYLDCVNNVAHVGHSHPRVVRAVASQMAVLNTNTRYLHESLGRYAARLTARLPEPLRVCYFVCSGSEANELALRLARARTAWRDVIVLNGAYHGNTSALIDISPYKYDGPGGRGAPPHVHAVVMPDPYRGPYRTGEPDLGPRYAAHVHEAVARLAAGGRGVCAFFCESLLSCGGQIVLPDGYLAEAYRAVRAAGGVCVADEVQVGFGRVGTHMWGFETQGVVPDIVTMGKPIGNGFPLGAVVTTSEIAGAFDNGMEYFNTFGGNPVACAAGLAVLDVVEDEGLQEHARDIGAVLLRNLGSLQEEFPGVGDVRGRGLFLGIELVDDRGSRRPAARQAAYVVNRARDRGVLLSTDGPDRNVIKIKPPMVFDRADAGRLVSTLREILREDPAQPAG